MSKNRHLSGEMTVRQCDWTGAGIFGPEIPQSSIADDTRIDTLNKGIDQFGEPHSFALGISGSIGPIDQTERDALCERMLEQLDSMR